MLIQYSAITEISISKAVRAVRIKREKTEREKRLIANLSFNYSIVIFRNEDQSLRYLEFECTSNDEENIEVTNKSLLANSAFNNLFIYLSVYLFIYLSISKHKIISQVFAIRAAIKISRF